MAKAVELGVTDLMSKKADERALAIRKTVFSVDNLMCFEEDDGDIIRIQIRYDQAMTSLLRANLKMIQIIYPLARYWCARRFE
jgi:hypothetical protein